MSNDGYFDASVAATYDDDLAQSDTEVIESVVDVLEGLAGSGRALEFAIGTGRIALPLAQRGVTVSGIELSSAMVARMRDKPGGSLIETEIGDMTTARIEGAFSLVFLVFNTINNLTSQDAQLACFKNAARHLAPGGCFVVEVGVPPLQWLAPGETLLAYDCSDTHWGVDEIDVVSQRFTSHHTYFRKEGVQRVSIPFRYVWPAELDLMAKSAGLSLSHRWEDWARTPFTDLSRTHVSVWQKAAS